jgi:hypothetical protein
MTGWAEGVVDAPDRPRTSLATHFEHGESSGMFESIDEKLPASSRDCRGLQEEHDGMLGDLESIREVGRGRSLEG